MTDDKEAAAAPPNSRAEIDIGDKKSLAEWAAALGVTGEALEGAVRKVGSRVDKIKDYLTGGMAADQEDA